MNTFVFPWFLVPLVVEERIQDLRHFATSNPPSFISLNIGIEMRCERPTFSNLDPPKGAFWRFFNNYLKTTKKHPLGAGKGP